MARKCVCKICKLSGDSNTFYKVTVNGKSNYYCNEEEYNNYTYNAKKHTELIDYVLYEVLNYEKGQKVNSILFKRIKELRNFYEYEVIIETFQQQKDTITYWINNKDFRNEYAMISYVMKIIEGSINDVYKKYKYKKQQLVKQENNNVDVDILNQVDMNNKNKSNNGILDFLEAEDI